jgi:hypothetical protein
VTLKGRYAGIRRSRTGGESLRVYDLRLARARGERVLRLRFTAVALDSAGVAAFVAPEGVGDTLDGVYPRSSAIEPTFVRILGPVVGWRENAQLRIQSLPEDRPFAVAVRDGTLYRQGDVAITIKRGGWLAASGTTLGAPKGDCTSPTSCTGIETIAIAGSFVATRAIEQGPGGLTVTLTLHNLSTGATSHPCPTPVGSFTLDAAGVVSCSGAT